jgi:hypothetical protein
MADVEKIDWKKEDDVMNVSHHGRSVISFFLYLLNSVMLSFFFYNGYL